METRKTAERIRRSAAVLVFVLAVAGCAEKPRGPSPDDLTRRVSEGTCRLVRADHEDRAWFACPEGRWFCGWVSEPGPCKPTGRDQ